MAFAPLALAAGIAGAGISAVGAVEQGQATANAATFSAEVAKNNALIADYNAQHAIQAGQTQAAGQSLKGAAAGGKIKAGQAASGIDVNSGSALNVQQSERETAKLDTETVLSNAKLQEYGYRSQETSFKAQSELDKLTAEQAPIGATIGAGGSLLSNASGLGFKWSTLGTATA